MTYEKRAENSSHIDEYHDRYAVCNSNGKSFLIDIHGKKASKNYYEIKPFKNGYAIGINGIKHDIINTNCKVVSTIYTEMCMGDVVKGNVWVNNRYGFSGLQNVLDKSFKTPNFFSVDCVDEEGFAVVTNFKKYSGSSAGEYSHAIYDANGLEVVPFGRYSYIGNFGGNGLILYSPDGNLLKSRIDSKDYIENKSTYYAGGGKLGYIDRFGNIIIKARYDKAWAFNEAGYAKVWEKRKEYIIDTRGTKLEGDHYNYAKATFLPDGHWYSFKSTSGKYFLINNKWRSYEFPEGNDLKLSCAYYNNKQFVLSRKGNTYNIYSVDFRNGNLIHCSTFEGGYFKNEFVYLKDNETVAIASYKYAKAWNGNWYKSGLNVKYIRLKDGMFLRSDSYNNSWSIDIDEDSIFQM